MLKRTRMLAFGLAVVAVGAALVIFLSSLDRFGRGGGATASTTHGQAGSGPVGIKIRAYLAPLIEMRDFSGVVVISKQGEDLVDGTYGFANYELNVPSEPTTRYGIGSITKTFTAAAILLLAQEGSLLLDDRVARFLPDLRYGDKITIAQLLRHEAGVPDYYIWPEYAQRRSQPISLSEFSTLIGNHPLAFTPGSQSSYSNSGYALLAAVIERASGSRFANYLRTKLLDPLEMRDTGDMADAGIVPKLATGYNPGQAPEQLQPPVRVHPSWLIGSGSLYSTAADLHRWAIAMQTGKMFRLDRLPYPYGWGERTVQGRKLWEQNGRIPLGYTSYLGIYPEDGTVVIALSNIQVDIAERLGRDLAAMVYGLWYEMPELRARAKVDAAFIKSYAGNYAVAPGFSLSVRADAEHLTLAGPEGDFLPLDPITTERFFFRALYVTVTFEHDATGRVTALNWDGSFTARRVR